MEHYSKASLVALAALFAVACASTQAVEPEASAEARLQDWSNVEKLAVGTAVRVTERDLDRFYGRVMVVTDRRLTLELVAGSQAIARNEILLVERFPASVPRSLPGAAVGAGAALALSSASSPRTYRRTVAPAQEAVDETGEHTRNGYYVDALELLGTSVQMVDRAIEKTRRTVVVYRAR